MKTTANTCANASSMCAAGTGWGEEMWCKIVFSGGRQS